MLVQIEYVKLHENLRGAILKELGTKLGLEHTDKWQEQETNKILEREILTFRLTEQQKLEDVIQQYQIKRMENSRLLNLQFQMIKRINIICTEKIRKYLELAIELQRLWNEWVKCGP